MSESNQLTAVGETDPDQGSQTQIAFQAPPENDGAWFEFLAAMVRDPTMEVTKLQALLDMKEKADRARATRAFNLALHMAQREMPRVMKSGTIDTGKGIMKFARWQDVDTALRPIMERHGFALTFTTAMRDGGGALVTASLTHILGDKLTSEMSLPLDVGPGRNNLQAMGSTISYGKRYLAEMIFNIVREDEDDDGNTGGADRPYYLTNPEIAEIRKLIKESKTDFKKFEAWVSTPLDQTPGSRFTELKTMLLAKLKQSA